MKSKYKHEPSDIRYTKWKRMLGVEILTSSCMFKRKRFLNIDTIENEGGQ